MEKDNEHMISLIGDIDRILNINGNEITSETDSQNQSQKSNFCVCYQKKKFKRRDILEASD